MPHAAAEPDPDEYIFPEYVPNAVQAAAFPATAPVGQAVTLATQGTLERVAPRLARYATAWGCAVSAAIYVDAPRGSQQAEEQYRGIAQLSAQLTAAGLNSVTISIMYANGADDGTVSAAAAARLARCTAAAPCDFEELKKEVVGAYMRQYPQNALRNLAGSVVATPFVAHVDIDFLVPRTACADFEGLGDHGTRDAMLHAIDRALKGQGTMMVMPAFQMPEGLAFPQKQELSATVDAGQVSIFKIKNYKRGQGATDYKKWYTNAAAYTVEPTVGYEPFFVAPTFIAPKYDERLRGYGKDRVLAIWTSVQSGWEMVVLPSVYIIHMDHAPSADRALYDTEVEAVNAATGAAYHEFKIFKWYTFWLEELMIHELLRDAGRAGIDTGTMYQGKATLARG